MRRGRKAKKNGTQEGKRKEDRIGKNAISIFQPYFTQHPSFRREGDQMMSKLRNIRNGEVSGF